MPVPTNTYSNTTLAEVFYTAYTWPDDQELDILTRNYPISSGKRLHIIARQCLNSLRTQGSFSHILLLTRVAECGNPRNLRDNRVIWSASQWPTPAEWQVLRSGEEGPMPKRIVFERTL